MEIKTDKSTCENAFGRKLAQPFDYDFKWTEYANGDELRQASKYPSEKEIVKLVNAQEKANARAAELAEQLEHRGIVRLTQENDPQERLKAMVKTILSNNSSLPAEKQKTEAEARQIASTVLGIDWAE